LPGYWLSLTSTVTQQQRDLLSAKPQLEESVVVARIVASALHPCGGAGRGNTDATGLHVSGGVLEALLGFPQSDPQYCYETFHPQCLLRLSQYIFSLFVCSRQLVLKIWKVSDLYLYQVVQHKSLIYLATSTIQTNIAKFYDEIK